MPNDPDDRESPLAPQRKNAGLTPLQKLKGLLLPKSRTTPVVGEDHVLSILASRRGREAALGRELFSDPAWDILLELYAAKLGHRRMALSDLARAIDMPESIIARWVTALSERGLILSASKSDEPAKLLVDLSSEGMAQMTRLLDYWGTAFRSI